MTGSLLLGHSLSNCTSLLSLQSRRWKTDEGMGNSYLRGDVVKHNVLFTSPTHSGAANAPSRRTIDTDPRTTTTHSRGTISIRNEQSRRLCRPRATLLPRRGRIRVDFRSRGCDSPTRRHGKGGGEGEGEHNLHCEASGERIRSVFLYILSVFASPFPSPACSLVFIPCPAAPHSSSPRELRADDNVTAIDTAPGRTLVDGLTPTPYGVRSGYGFEPA